MRLILKIINFWLVRWAVTLAWTAVLVVILVQPETQPIINTGVQPAPPSLQREIAFATLHIVSFSFTSLLWIWTLRDIPVWQVGGLVLIIGIITEFMQANAPGRTPQVTDVLANGFGILLAIIALRFWHQRVSEPSSKMPVG